MSKLASTVRDFASPSMIRRLELACDAFEAAWGSGSRPSIEDFLGDQRMTGHPDLLRELLVLEIAYRRRAAEITEPGDYEARFPGDRRAVAEAFASIARAVEGVSSESEESRYDLAGLPAIPGYAVLGELGRGGMGVVFKARTDRLSRVVALKMILAGDLAGPEAAARFVAEAEAVARLQHPQVVQIFRIGDHRGRPYLEMEFVDGGSLASRLDGTPWPPKRATALVESLARAVHHAHQRGIVHRDLKPANILITTDGLPKLTDFGLAKSLGADEGLTRTDSIVGSPSYMAPEQAGASGFSVGPPTDVYALGAILYELLTGRPPFRAATVLETLEQVKTAEPAAPSKVQPGLPIDVETIALKCLQKEPGKRYPDAEALAEDLQRFSAGEPILARPVGSIERAIKWARRHPATAALALASVVSMLLLIGVLATASVVLGNQQRETRNALIRERLVKDELATTNRLLSEQKRQTEEALKTKTVALEERSEDLIRERQAAYFQRIALADSEKLLGRVDRANQLLDDCPVDLRGWEWRYLRRPTANKPVSFSGHTAEVWDATLSPDGKTLATASFDNTVRTWNAADGRPIQTLQGHEARVYSVAFDRFGKRLVSASADKTAIVWDLETGKPLHVLRGHTDNVRCAAFNPSGYTIATGGWDGPMRIWDTKTGRLQKVLSTEVGWITRLAFNPDGRWITVAGSAGRAEVWDYYRGIKLVSLEENAGAVLGVAFSPDGLRVAASSNAGSVGTVKVWEIVGTMQNGYVGREVLSFRDPTAMFERVVFSPDGRRLATSGWDGTVKVWNAGDGREILTLRGHGDRVWGVAFSPSGEAIVSASADHKALLWDGSHP